MEVLSEYHDHDVLVVFDLKFSVRARLRNVSRKFAVMLEELASAAEETSQELKPGSWSPTT